MGQVRKGDWFMTGRSLSKQGIGGAELGVRTLEELRRQDAAKEHSCRTPGTFFDTAISDRDIVVRVRLPIGLGLTEVGAAALEARLHDALERVLAPHFDDDPEARDAA